jgi:hypothetical protein
MYILATVLPHDSSKPQRGGTALAKQRRAAPLGLGTVFELANSKHVVPPGLARNHPEPHGPTISSGTAAVNVKADQSTDNRPIDLR